MLPPTAPIAGGTYFHADTKCCTHVPVIANFLVDRLLDDDTPEMAAGRATVEARIAAGRAVIPMGLSRTHAEETLYREAIGAATELFGREPAMRCPHYIAGGCGIWKHRPGVCATWFCKHERGAAGFAAWSAMRALFNIVELQLARWCLLEIAPGDELIAYALGDSSASPWGGWVGRERELYRACAARVAALTWSEILAISGVEARGQLELARRALAPRTELPERMRPKGLKVLQMTEQRCTAVTYSPYDPIEMPRELFDALGAFDGRPTDEVVASLRDRGLGLDTALLHKLLDFAVLAAG